jgi:hypothetical protein
MFAEMFTEAVVFCFRIQFLNWIGLEKLMEIQVDLRIYMF